MFTDDTARSKCVCTHTPAGETYVRAYGGREHELFMVGRYKKTSNSSIDASSNTVVFRLEPDNSEINSI